MYSHYQELILTYYLCNSMPFTLIHATPLAISTYDKIRRFFFFFINWIIYFHRLVEIFQLFNSKNIYSIKFFLLYKIAFVYVFCKSRSHPFEQPHVILFPGALHILLFIHPFTHIPIHNTVGIRLRCNIVV